MGNFPVGDQMPFFRRREILFLTIGQKEIRFRLLKDHGRAGIMSRFYREPCESSQGITDILRKFLPCSQSFPQARPCKVFLLLARQDVIFQQLVLPSHDERELRLMLAWQIPKLGPFQFEEVVFDYVVLEKKPDGCAHILVIIVPRTTVEKYFQMLGDSAKRVGAVFLESQWKIAVFRGISSAAGEGAVAVVVLDTHEPEICFLEKGRLRFSRILTPGREEGLEVWAEKCAQEILHNFELYDQEHWGPALEKIYLWGEEGAAGALRKILSAESGCPVEIVANPEQDSAGRPWPVGDARNFISQRPLELFPPDFRSRQLRQRVFSLARDCLVLFLFVLFLPMCAEWPRLVYLRQQVQSLEEENSRLRPRADAALRHMQDIQRWQKIFEQRLLVRDTMRYFYELALENLFFRSMALRSDGCWFMEGHTKEKNNIYEFQERLISSGKFSNVALRRVEEPPIMNGGMTEFRMECCSLKGKK